MRYVFRFWFAFALGLALMAGCSDENGGGGTGGMGGTGGTGGTAGTGGTGGTEPACQGTVCACTEAGIRAAIAEGGGPFTFDCDGPTTVVTEAEIVIDNDVILDGEGNLTVDGDEGHRVFFVAAGITAELRRFTVTKGFFGGIGGGGIYNSAGTLTLTHSTVSGNSASHGGGIDNDRGTLTLTNSTVSDNSAELYGGGIDNHRGTLTLTNSTVSGNSAKTRGGGIYNSATLTLTSSTVSGNTGSGIVNDGETLTLTNSTVSGNTGIGIVNDGETLTLTNSTVSGNTGIGIVNDGTLTLANTLVDDDCSVVYGGGNHESRGGNLESPGYTCGLDQETDQVNVSAEQLNLGPLANNGGPTMTHALLPGSVAIDQIPAEDCVDAEGEPLTTDQRGEPRPETGGTMCDVGAFEVQP